LVIEIDGVTHNGKQSYDTRRENRLKELGSHVLRFDGYYVIKNIGGTLEVIMRRIEDIERKTSP
jgi:very-short-patch-repair endonuclease